MNAKALVSTVNKASSIIRFLKAFIAGYEEFVRVYQPDPEPIKEETNGES